MNKGAKIAVGVWDVLYPLALYYAATIILMFAAQVVFGRSNENYMLCEIVATTFTIPIMYYSFYKPDKLIRTFIPSFLDGKSEINTDAWYIRLRTARGILQAVTIIGLAAFVGVGMNNIILMSPLLEVSEGYKEAADHFYGGTIAFELIGSAFLTPILEELVYRGIIYSRCKHMLKNKKYGVLWATIVSSLIFAIMHFNIVQFIYAFVIGFVLILFMEKTGHVCGAILGHITINTISVVRTETGLLSQTVNGSVFAWSVSVAAFLCGCIGLLTWIKRKR